MQPLVSIIIPNYNHEKYLKQRLQSIFNQTFQDFEVILLDDCSTDDSREILAEFAQVPRVSQCIFNEVNTGDTFIQWNRGIELAKGEIIWIAESDDFCDLNFLETVVAPMLDNTKIVLSYCQSNRVNEEGIVTGNWLNHTNDIDKALFLSDFKAKGNEFIEKYLIYKNVIPNASAVVFRKNKVVELGYLTIDPTLKYCGDWLFYLQLITNSEVSYSAKMLNNFRYHSESVIAKSSRFETKTAIIDIDLMMRKKMMIFLFSKKLTNINAIKDVNIQIVKHLNYLKAMIFIRNNEKFKGFSLLLPILDVFFKNYQFKKNLKNKFVGLFKFVQK
jgi:glycosyltransferase involved in cell wall biosynthesis